MKMIGSRERLHNVTRLFTSHGRHNKEGSFRFWYCDRKKAGADGGDGPNPPQGKTYVTFPQNLAAKSDERSSHGKSQREDAENPPKSI